MPRVISVTVATEKTDALIEQMQNLENVSGLALQRGASIEPPGDIVTISANNDGVRAIFKVLEKLEVTDGGSISTSEPRSLLSPPSQRDIDSETNETIWDEMASLLRQDTNLSANFLMLMALAGIVAATGLWTDTLHTVIGAMLIAPGFEPLLRIPFGLIGGPRELAQRGLLSTLAGYVALFVGAALTYLFLRWLDPGSSPDLTTRYWARYWSDTTAIGAFVAFVGGITGAIVITTQRSTLTAGVMIALALVPTMALVGMASVYADWKLAGGALILWLVNVVAVLVASAITFGLKQIVVHRGKSMG